MPKLTTGARPQPLPEETRLRIVYRPTSDLTPYAVYARTHSTKPIVVRTSTQEARRVSELIALIADARRWRDDLLKGRAASIKEITTREGLSKGAVRRILPLAWLAPDIGSAILEGGQPAVLTSTRLRALPDMPLGWADQRALLGVPAN